MVDPLNEFAIEDAAELPEQLSLHAVSAPPAPRPLQNARPSKASWLIAAGTLVIGLVTGLAIGMALVRWNAWLGEPMASALTVPAQNLDARDRALPTIGEQPVAQPAPMNDAEESLSEPAALPASTLQARAVPPSGPALLYVESRPAGAEVHLDGQLVSTTPFQLSDLSPGPHTLRIELPGFKTWSTTVTSEPGARIRVAASLER